jgi:hypothetical protein
LVQVVGGDACGPYTVKLMVPVAELPEDAARRELIALAAIAVPVTSELGAAIDTEGVAGLIVSLKGCEVEPAKPLSPR